VSVRERLIGSDAVVESLTVLTHREILGVRIDATSYPDAWHRIHHWILTGTEGYIVAANVHVVMTAYWTPTYAQVLQAASLVTPDGMPLVWALRLLGLPHQQRVYGPDLMGYCCEQLARLGWPLYLYGGTPEMLARLQEYLPQRFPGLAIAGAYAPPFRPQSPEEEAADVHRINTSGAVVAFIALGCPKQEYWMAQQQGQLRCIALGVGAAFSFYSHTVSQAPRWMMNLGLEWLYRFSQEPGRLWRRYLLYNPAFVVLFGSQYLATAWKQRR
jgi:N-acetylglucosaminyldiphosphoundecaprenol N-acetyl-beta-D-mannosaminyltransferase